MGRRGWGGKGASQSRSLANSCRKQPPGLLPPLSQNRGHGGMGMDAAGPPGEDEPCCRVVTVRQHS